MKILWSMAVALFLFSCISDNYFKRESLAFELRAASVDYSNDGTPMPVYGGNATFFVNDSTVLDNEDIAATEIIEWQSGPQVKVILTDQGKERLAVFTGKYTGAYAAILIDGVLVSAPRINARIDQGILLIVGNFTRDEAESIRDGIRPK